MQFWHHIKRMLSENVCKRLSAENAITHELKLHVTACSTTEAFPWHVAKCVLSATA